jgi:hypothetical protein
VRIAGFDLVVTAMRGCVNSTLLGSAVQTCSSLVVTIAADLWAAVPGGALLVELQNPDPLSCSVSNNTLLSKPPTLKLLNIVPTDMCVNALYNVTLNVTGWFLGQTRLYVDGTQQASISERNCAPLNYSLASSPGAQECHTVEFFKLDTTGRSPGTPVALRLVRSQSGYSGCEVDDNTSIILRAAPSVSQRSPSRFCQSNGGTLELVGANFMPSIQVALCTGSCQTPFFGNVTVHNSTHLTVSFAANSIQSGSYQIYLNNGPGCSSVTAGVANIVDVLPIVLVFYVNPPVVYNGIDISALIYASGLSSDPATVLLLGPQNQTVTLTRTSINSPNRINVIIPAGLAPGQWRMQIITNDGCDGVLNNAVVISNTTSITLSAVDPSTAWVNETVGVRILAAANTNVSFQAVPTVYLTPSNAGAGTTAKPVEAVGFYDSLTLVGVVLAQSLPIGTYDVIVVNPSGAVGVLRGGFTIVAQPTPVVLSAAPNSIKLNSPTTVYVSGANFDTVNGTQVWLECRYYVPLANPLLSTTITRVNVSALTVVSSSSLNFLTNFATVPGGSLCLVVVRNNRDNSTFRWSALAVKQTNGNVIGFSTQWTTTPLPTLNLARYSHSQFTMYPTPSDRRFFVLGGRTNATAGSPYTDTIEASEMGLYGDLKPFVTLRARFPTPIAYASAQVINNFVYVAGGETSDSSGAVKAVRRAQILNPLDAPVIEPSLDLNATSGHLTAGLWHYAVSALFAAADPINPGGESLPSTTLTLNLPNLAGMFLILQWDAVPRAVGYRIYRTASAGLTPSQVQFLADVTVTSFFDYGTLSTNASVTPLSTGELGRWATVQTLTTARRGLQLTVLSSPIDSQTYFMYAVGGANSSVATSVISTVEHTTITKQANGDQAVAAFASVTPTGGVNFARQRFPAASINYFLEVLSTYSPYVQGIYVWGGSGSGGPLSDAAAFTVGNSSAPITFASLSGSAGPFGFDASGYLYAFPNDGTNPGISNGAVTLTGTTPGVPSGWKTMPGTNFVPTGTVHDEVAFSVEVPYLIVSGGIIGSTPQNTLSYCVQ